MPTFDENFGFRQSPFERYVAEREPEIDQYAVRPPYYEEARRRIFSHSSYILFGFRGSGKSATRLTSEKDTWNKGRKESRQPLLVSFTDFDPLLRSKSSKDIGDIDLVKRVAFLTIEAILLWMSNQSEGEKFIELLDQDEYQNISALARGFYLTEPQESRAVSQSETMKLLQQSWSNIAGVWVQKRWSGIASIVGVFNSAFSKEKLGTDDISAQVAELLKKGEGSQSCRLIMQKLAEAAQSLGFSGVVVMVDKVDEHPKTQRSPIDAAQLIHPIISQVQLMEVKDFSWIFFLWDKIKAEFSHGDLAVRLDKFAHSDIVWPEEFLGILVDKRVEFFSEQQLLSIRDLCDDDVDVQSQIAEMIALVQRSPRELIRLLDTVSREFTSNYASSTAVKKLSQNDLDLGKDAYVRDVLWTIYESRLLSQILRFNTSPFTNKDVQQAFRISSAGARGRIQSWEAAGAINLTGTRAPEGDSGGKPANEYSIVDRRIIRMADRNLYDPDKLSEAPIGEEDV